MDQLLTNSDLPDRHLINEELLAETARQIEKDLRLPKLDLPVRSSDQSAFDRLFSALQPEIKALVSEGVSDLPQKLYQVDLPEKYVNQALSSPRAAEFLTEAIIKRCFQKVVLRRLYRREKND